MRLFLAVGLPEPVRAAGEAAVRALDLPPADWRLVRSDGWHLTVRFLGECDAERTLALDPVWRAAAAGTGILALRLGALVAFPDARHPRVLGLRIEESGSRGALASLADRIEHAARAHGFPPEPRAFTPHVTVARARSRRPPLPGRAADVAAGEFVTAALTLYRSELGPSGARYDVEATYPLGLSTAA